ncbi:MAG: glycerophosphodiester phosphodiesterase [Armatimonadetes bacterium]|nr:glycerophosphodiester phosphodiesterase [Armatimonadota bacterium]
MIEVVGHRGAKGLVPENTLPSFEKAIALGCDATECDVHLSADGHLVVCHDHTVDRTTNGTGRIAELTLAELRALDAGDGALIPLFGEVLDLVRDRILLLCELKGDGTADAAVAAVRKAGMVEQVVFSCFDLDRIARVRELGDELRITGIHSAFDADALARLVDLRAEHMDICWQALTVDQVATIHAAGLRCRGWNPDTEADIRTTLELGVDSVSSNYPDLAVRVVRG